jgi:hypothetical protein
MASAVKFENFVEDLGEKRHDLGADTLKALLALSAPSAANDGYKADLTDELGTANGYTAGGEDSQNTGARAGGTFTVTGTKIVWTASGGSIGPFRYVVLYNDTQAAPSADGLIIYWDYGSNVTLNVGETFSVKFNNSDTTGTILTIA